MNKFLSVALLLLTTLTFSVNSYSEILGIDLQVQEPTYRENGISVGFGEIEGYSIRYSITDTAGTLTEGTVTINTDYLTAGVVTLGLEVEVLDILMGVNYTGTFEVQAVGLHGEVSDWSPSMTKEFSLATTAKFLPPSILNINIKSCQPYCIAL